MISHTIIINASSKSNKKVEKYKEQKKVVAKPDCGSLGIQDETMKAYIWLPVSTK